MILAPCAFSRWQDPANSSVTLYKAGRSEYDSSAVSKSSLLSGLVSSPVGMEGAPWPTG